MLTSLGLGGSVFRQGGDGAGGSGDADQEDEVAEGQCCSVPLEGDAALPAGGAGPGVLAAGEALQPQLCQEETVFGTGEPTRPRTH